MHRRAEDGAKAARLRRAIGGEQLHLVHAFLIVDDGAARTENLHEDAALAAPGGAAEQQRRVDPAGKAQQRGGDVEGLDLARAGRTERALGIGREHVAEHAVDRAEQGRDQAQRMHPEIVERAKPSRLLAAPGKRRGGVGHEILVHLDADVIDRADRPGIEQLANLPHQRVLDVVITEQRDLAGGLGRSGHGLRVGQ